MDLLHKTSILAVSLTSKQGLLVIIRAYLKRQSFHKPSYEIVFHYTDKKKKMTSGAMKILWFLKGVLLKVNLGL